MAEGLEKCAALPSLIARHISVRIIGRHDRATVATIASGRYVRLDITNRDRISGNRMAHKRDVKLLECADCKKVILLSNTTAESTCPGCGSANGQVISSTELERRIEEGAVFNIDLTPDAGDRPKRQ